ncbi:hypothetical protein Gocc_0437 [Gaiella occulta]|uniref:Uncharacterized protein n=1 Tax=Gaiella occulta TaxID=1002870 RepID=A0A7M2Z0T5_9ACTN|nr:hypothetical protein [Gaiella occulta]RDI76018.1 hypothetical protein Gocc_0437 [Gaiella occulta]
MNLCVVCGSGRAADASGTCLPCAERREASFRSVRTYLYENARATVDEIARATGVSEGDVFALLNEGRLTGHGRGVPQPACHCGQPGLDSLDGRCPDCHNRLARRIARLPADVREEFERWGKT